MFKQWWLVLGLWLVACASGQPTANPKPLRAVPTPTEASATPILEKNMRYLALGDSYTIGENVAEAERWPGQLVARLREQGIAITEPEIIAVTGWTTDELAAGIQRANPQRPYDLVTLLIGVNNQYRGRAPEEYRQQFATLLQQAIGFAGDEPARVIVLSIPDWGVTPYATGRDVAKIAAEIDTFNAINREEAEKAGAAYVDVTAVSREAAHDPTLIANDGLHPSGKMYAAWVELVLPVALGIVSSKQ
jgi:lysophospholipase L1-like esterase